MATMTIMRGLPAAGKSTTTKPLEAAGAVVCSADHFFEATGSYVFDPSKIGQAHKACMDKATSAVNANRDVVIDNTNTQRWEFESYIQLALSRGFAVVIKDVFDGGCTDEQLAERQKATHGVPVEALRRMRARWEPTSSMVFPEGVVVAS